MKYIEYLARSSLGRTITFYSAGNIQLNNRFSFKMSAILFTMYVPV